MREVFGNKATNVVLLTDAFSFVNSSVVLRNIPVVRALLSDHQSMILWKNPLNPLTTTGHPVTRRGLTC